MQYTKSTFIPSFTIRCSLSIVLILFENLLASTYCGRQDSMISSTSIIREFPFYCEVDKSAPSIAYLIGWVCIICFKLKFWVL